jgi:hypothetical protein
VAEVPIPAARSAASSPPTGTGRAPSPSAAAPAPRAPKRSAREAWKSWRATGAEGDAISFYQSVVPWLEGTSAQLARPAWPSGAVRPSSAEIEARLREALGLVLANEADYIEALDAARRRVANQLRNQRARDASR